MQKIKICLITDNNYVIPTVVAITSMIENKNEQSEYDINVLADNLDQFHKSKIAELETNKVSVNIIDVDATKYEQISVKTHVSTSALVKFDIANIFKTDEKILYLDGDIIVQKDLSELYNQNMETFSVLAIRDMAAECYHNFHKSVGADKYFNSGVMLLNLDKIRNENLSEVLLQTKLNNPQWLCMDQDSFNYVFKNHVHFLDVKYNSMIPLYNLIKYPIEEVNKFYEVSYDNFLEMQESAVIIHFAGVAHLRPWKVINGSMSDIWMKYYNKSPYKNISLSRGIFSPDTERVDYLINVINEQNNEHNCKISNINEELAKHNYKISRTNERLSLLIRDLKYSKLKNKIFSIRSLGNDGVVITVLGIKYTRTLNRAKNREN